MNNYLTVILLASVVLVPSAQAVIVFADNFEPGTSGIVSQQSVTATQDVLTYNVTNTSRNFNSSIWVDSTVGFGSDRQGLIDGGTGGTDFGNFTPDAAGSQAYGFRYTNSGLTSDVGVIGILTAGTVITFTFDVFIDGWNGGSAYDAYLVTFNGGTRSDLDSGGAVQGTTSVFAKLSGTASGSSYQTVSFSYTVGDDVIDSNGEGAGTATTFDTAVLGHDIAIRFDGATNYANIDNVSVDISPVPESSILSLLAVCFGFTYFMPRRRA